MDIQPLPSEEEPLRAPLTMLFGLIVGTMIGSMIGSGLALGVAQWAGFDLLTLVDGVEVGSRGERNMVRVINLINHLMTFTVAPLLVIYLFTRDRWASFLRLTRQPDSRPLLFGLLFILAGFPLAQTTYWLNQQLPAPEWAVEMERAASGMLESVLTMQDAGEFLLTLLVVGIVPALGEEILFRGGIQRNLERLSGRPHLAIWSTALFFSAVHLQFEGFIPRTLLGAGLGYVYFWTRNLWVPIVAHFAFNGAQVIAQYATADPAESLQLERVESPQWIWALFGSVIMAYCGYQLFDMARRQGDDLYAN